jgi:hypothetical protein
MSVEELPNYENAVRLAREARGIRTATGIGTRSKAGWKIESALEPHRASPQRLSGARRRAVLGLCVLLLAVFFVTRVHVHAHHASLVAAADVPAARIREVDDMRMANLAAIGALAVTSGALAGDKIPDGWVVIADASTQLSNAQGQDGWSYLFDSGLGSNEAAMPFQPVWEDGTLTIATWGVAPRLGCSGPDIDICHISRKQVDVLPHMHTKSASGCCGPQNGPKRPILRWSAPSATAVKVLFRPSFAVSHDNTFALLLNGKSMLSGGSSSGNQQFIVEGNHVSTITLRMNPGSTCTYMYFDLVILAPDCNGNSIADAVEIANGSEFDANGDGILDSCQCPGDVVENGIVDGADLAALLSVWGTDGGIYPRADTNSDGFVDAQDLAAVLSGWGACP